jgi:hypothetical protein
MTRDKRQKRVDPNAPKRPTNAFMRYATSRRNEIPDHQPKGTDFMRQLGQEWASLSKLEKEPFFTESMADLVRARAPQLSRCASPIPRHSRYHLTPSLTQWTPSLLRLGEVRNGQNRVRFKSSRCWTTAVGAAEACDQTVAREIGYRCSRPRRGKARAAACRVQSGKGI